MRTGLRWSILILFGIVRMVCVSSLCDGKRWNVWAFYLDEGSNLVKIKCMVFMKYRGF